MDATLTTNARDDSASTDSDPAAPPALVREVAASLKSLAKVLPYPEYAEIVHRIADLRWRCETSRAMYASED